MMDLSPDGVAESPARRSWRHVGFDQKRFQEHGRAPLSRHRETACAKRARKGVQVVCHHLIGHARFPNPECHLVCHIMIEQNRVDVIGWCQFGFGRCVEQRVVFRVVVRIAERHVREGDVDEGLARAPEPASCAGDLRPRQR